jgi:CBS domain-containing protein
MPNSTNVHRILGNRSSVVTAAVDQTVHDAACTMRAEQVGCVLVVDCLGIAQGILSERDVLIKVVAEGLDARKTPVRDVMTKDVVFCEKTTCISDAQRTMARNEIRHLPILDNGKPVGMISSRDILSYQSSTVEDIARMQTHVIERLQRLFGHALETETAEEA